MRLSVAQVRSTAGDILANLAKHEEAVRRAVELRADLVLFPELSLTGYEPALAQRLAVRANDSRLDRLQSLSDANEIIICAGMPLAGDIGVEIAMFLFQPSSPRLTYSKQLLHADELPYFACGDGQTLLRKGGHVLVPAICYESMQPQHAEAAASLRADVYLASVAKSTAGVVKASRHYPLIARNHNMMVVMANCLGPSDTFIGAGCSAGWNSQGELVGQLDDQHEGVVVFDTDTQEMATATW